MTSLANVPHALKVAPMRAALATLALLLGCSGAPPAEEEDETDEGAIVGAGEQPEVVTFDMCAVTQSGKTYPSLQRRSARPVQFQQRIARGTVGTFQLGVLTSTDLIKTNDALREMAPRTTVTVEAGNHRSTAKGNVNYLLPAAANADLFATITVQFPPAGGRILATGCRPQGCAELGAERAEPLDLGDKSLDVRIDRVLRACKPQPEVRGVLELGLPHGGLQNNRPSTPEQQAAAEAALAEYEGKSALMQCTPSEGWFHGKHCLDIACGETMLGEHPALKWVPTGCR